MKVLECNLGDKLRLGKDILDMTPKKLIKEQIDKLNFIKINNFWCLKKIGKRMKRQFTEWEKIFVKCTSDEFPYSE